MKIGDRVRYSETALRPTRDYWLGLGDYSHKNRAKDALDAKTALRGCVTAIIPQGLSVAWDDGTSSNLLSYMVTVEEP